MKQDGFSALVIRLAALTAALLLVVFSLGAAPPRVSEFPGVTIENFGKINDHYYRGSQPNKEQMAQLKQLGIKTVIDLRKDNEPSASAWASSVGLQYFNIPLKSSTAANEKQTSYFLSLVNDRGNWPVYVHCKGGRHRTGALTAIYRITQDGWTADQAFQEMKQYDFDNGLFGGPAGQKKYVYSFYDHFRAESKPAEAKTAAQP